MVLEAVGLQALWPNQTSQTVWQTRASIQRYRCHDCGRSAPAYRFVQTYTHKARDPLVKQQITQMALNGAGVRDTLN
ncbi:IS1-like element transposase [Spirosoma utsteinense]|uniref:IS1-like element transposase n=1 Tax=Spirosoma utsteinense TaxID=2585773 RepID=UPI003742AC30